MYPGEDYTCAYQSCDPSPCAEGETCVIQESFPPIVTCSPPDECNLECSAFQVCLHVCHVGKIGPRARRYPFGVFYMFLFVFLLRR